MTLSVMGLQTSWAVCRREGKVKRQEGGGALVGGDFDVSLDVFGGSKIANAEVVSERGAVIGYEAVRQGDLNCYAGGESNRLGLDAGQGQVAEIDDGGGIGHGRARIQFDVFLTVGDADGERGQTRFERRYWEQPDNPPLSP